MPLTAFTLVMRDVLLPGLTRDFGAQVDGVADEPFFVGLQVEDAGVAGVDRAFEDGDRALRQVQAGGVLELEASSGCLACTAWL